MLFLRKQEATMRSWAHDGYESNFRAEVPLGTLIGSIPTLCSDLSIDSPPPTTARRAGGMLTGGRGERVG